MGERAAEGRREAFDHLAELVGEQRPDAVFALAHRMTQQPQKHLAAGDPLEAQRRGDERLDDLLDRGGGVAGLPLGAIEALQPLPVERV